MARRKKNKSPRRRNTAVSITGLAEAVMLANVGTNAAFNLSAWDFVTDGWGAGSTTKATGANQLSMWEMIYGNAASKATVYLPGGSSQTVTMTPGSNAEVVMQNLQNNWLPAVIQGVAIPVGFKIGRKVLRKPISMGNKLLKVAGLRSMVRI